MRGILAVITSLGFLFSFGAAISGCGGGSGGSDEIPTLIEGLLIDSRGAPVQDATVFIFETHEGSVTDDTGAFSITSFKELHAAKFFAELSPTRFSTTADIGAIPGGTVTVRVLLSLDAETGNLSVSRVDFDSAQGPGPTPPPAETPQPGQTPRPTATPKPPPFDSDGNTASFGIPTGMTGNIAAGRVVWTDVCAFCHSNGERANRTYGQIKAALATVKEMKPLRVSNQKVADVTAYLNRNRR